MKNGPILWTLDELTSAVEAALSKGYEGSASGRVRDIPDRRTIRYYTTLGLIDRPASMRGRTALYDRRHLLQLVAIKKLQAEGRTLAEIQGALAGRTIPELARIAGEDPGRDAITDRPKPDRDFWRQEPAPHQSSEEAPALSVDRPLALSGIPLHPGVTLLLVPSRPIDADDLDAIRSAAIPLIRTLTRSRLIDPREGGEHP